MLKKYKTMLLAMLGVWVAYGCGVSLYQPFDKPDTASLAIYYLEKDEPEKARKLLEKAIEKKPNDYELRSLLSYAIAQSNGLDPISLALNAALPKDGAEGEASKSNTAIEKLFSIVPEATDAIISEVGLAIFHLDSIPATARSGGDRFKLMVLHTVILTLETKKLDTNHNGKVDPEEVLGLGAEAAIIILDSLLASEQLAAEGLGGTESKDFKDSIGKIREGIKSQPGSNDQDKLKSYLENRPT